MTTNNQTTKRIINYYPYIDIYILEYKRLLFSFYKKGWVSISELAIIMNVGRNQASDIVNSIVFDKEINHASRPIRKKGNRYNLLDLIISLGYVHFPTIGTSIEADESLIPNLRKLKIAHQNRKELIQKMMQYEKEIKQIMKSFKSLNIKDEYADFTELQSKRFKIKNYIYTKPYITIQEFAFILDIDEKKASSLLQDAINGGAINPNRYPLRKIYSKYNLYDLSEIFGFSNDIYHTVLYFHFYLQDMYNNEDENVKAE